MKILIIHDKEMNQVSLGADSAVLRPTEPLFLDERRESRSLLVPAARIGRLGFHIPVNVAENYVDATSIFHLLVEEGCKCPLGIADRTFFPGHWEEGITKTFNMSASVSSSISETTSDNFVKHVENLPVKEAVSKLSEWCTLKTGDVILFVSEALDLGAPAIDTEIIAQINGSTVLELRIK